MLSKQQKTASIKTHKRERERERESENLLWPHLLVGMRWPKLIGYWLCVVWVYDDWWVPH